MTAGVCTVGKGAEASAVLGATSPMQSTVREVRPNAHCPGTAFFLILATDSPELRPLPAHDTHHFTLPARRRLILVSARRQSRAAALKLDGDFGKGAIVLPPSPETQ